MNLKEKIEAHGLDKKDTFYVLYDPDLGFLNSTTSKTMSVRKYPGTGSKKRVKKSVTTPKFEEKIDLGYARTLSELRSFVETITWMKHHRDYFTLDLTKLVPIAFVVEKKVTFTQKKTKVDLQKHVSNIEMDYVAAKLKQQP